MQLSLISDNRRPEGFQSDCDYLIIADQEPISVGDIVSVSCDRYKTAKIVAIWVSFVIKHIQVSRTESGHKHIIRLDRNLGDVPSDRKVQVSIISDHSD